VTGPRRLAHAVPMFEGESFASYITRAAAFHQTTVAGIESGLHDQNYLTDADHKHSAKRIEVWRQLGGLPNTAFTEPKVTGGEYVTERPICVGCTGGETAFGRQARLGSVCIEHSCWLGPGFDQVDAACTHAETIFRETLAPRFVLFDSLEMRVGLECAAVTASTDIVGDKTLSRNDLAILLYPLTIKFACLLSDPEFLQEFSDGLDADSSTSLSELVASAVSRIAPADGSAELWRAETRVRRHVHKLLRDGNREFLPNNAAL
jgi:hypothetical protein